MDIKTVEFRDAGFLENRYGCDRSAFSRWTKSKSFPAPRYLGSKRVWILAEILVWEEKWLSQPVVAPAATKNLIPFREG